MKFCPECGSKLASESAKFCSECGFKLNISNPLNVEESGEIKCNISSEKEEVNEFEKAMQAFAYTRYVDGKYVILKCIEPYAKSITVPKGYR